MAKSAPVATAKPTIRFAPKRRQYESGIDFVDKSGRRHKITLEGFTAPTFEDEQTILRMMERDPFCGITTYENREMPVEQKQAETKVRALEAENKAMGEEMDAMRQEIARLQAAQKPTGGG